MVVKDDTIIKGEIRNARHIEIYGYVEGKLATEHVIIHEHGRFYGTIRAASAEVHGNMQGEVFIKNLIRIGSTGEVNGKVQYGQLALDHGGNLSAELKNVPPVLAGDLNLVVDRGRSVAVTLEDLRAFDPDDTAENLTFTISNARNGFIMLAGGSSRPVQRFTQADLQNGKVVFVHDGTPSPVASFDVVVADHEGSTSGSAQSVQVSVRG